MNAKGRFDVQLNPQDDGEHAAGRMLIDKTYSGDMEGTGRGQMISKRTEGGAALYYAVEEFSGTIAGKSGTFTLVHRGFMDATSQQLEIEILSGSGTGAFESISGAMTIDQSDGDHKYELTYEL